MGHRISREPEMASELPQTRIPRRQPLQDELADRSVLSRWFMESAKAEMEKGDRLQASEKAWGALAQQLKAIGAARGWFHASHAHVREIGVQIGREHNDSNIVDLTHRGLELHVNFYENNVSPSRVAAVISAIESLLNELEALRTAPPRPYTVDSQEAARRIQLLTGQPVNIGDSSPTGFVIRNPAVGPDGEV